MLKVLDETKNNVNEKSFKYIFHVYVICKVFFAIHVWQQREMPHMAAWMTYGLTLIQIALCHFVFKQGLSLYVKGQNRKWLWVQ